MQDSLYTLHHGDCLDVLPTLAPVASIVTDPPAGISFMGAEWDGDRGGRDLWIAWLGARLRAAAALLPPGGAALVWALPRTSHWTALAIEDAGLRIDDRLSHVFGTGFPKHKSKLKPAVEDWWLCRKPGGAGWLNVDGCRVGTEPIERGRAGRNTDGGYGKRFGSVVLEPVAGRYPPHLLLSHGDDCAPGACVEGCPVRVLGEQSGERPTPATYTRSVAAQGEWLHHKPAGSEQQGFGDIGTAARFFPQFSPDPPFLYAAKASRRERNAGCEGMEEQSLHRYNNGDGFSGRTNIDGEWRNTNAPRIPTSNHHPTVKSQALMRWLVRLVTPPGGVVLDPFMGSGSTGVAAITEGFGFVGVEYNAEYLEIARARIAHAAGPLFAEEAA